METCLFYLRRLFYFHRNFPNQNVINTKTQTAQVKQTLFFWGLRHNFLH
jgi:hypothetical protein